MPQKLKLDMNQFESTFNSDWALKVIYETKIYAILFAISYITFSKSADILRKNKKIHNLKYRLIIWNLFVGIFNFYGARYYIPELKEIIQNRGLIYSVCNSEFFVKDPTALWTFLYAASKILELGDTMFLILMRKPLTFIHIYSHTFNFLYTWFNYGNFVSTALWYGSVGYLINGFKYLYFSILYLDFIYVPKVFKKLITSLNFFKIVFEMSLMMLVILLNITQLRNTISCGGNLNTAIIGFFFYFSSLCLAFKHSFNITSSKKIDKKLNW